MPQACSFLPAATHMIQAMGLEDRLLGVTFECPSDLPKVVRSHLEGHGHASAALDAVVSEAAQSGRSLYYMDEALLAQLKPDVVFTQHVCDVCQIGTSYVEQALYRMEHKPEVVALVPRRLPDVTSDVRSIASALGSPEAGERLVTACQERLNGVVDRLREARALPVRAMVLEWLDPLYNCGHWIPDQIAFAGGTDALSNPGGYSVPLEWERVRAYDPEVLVVAPCGFDVARSRQELGRLTEREGWSELQAVQKGRAFLADAHFFTQPSLPGLTTGVELLAHLFHPGLFTPPQEVVGRYCPIA